MFTLEESALLARLLRVVGCVLVLIAIAVAVVLFRHGSRSAIMWGLLRPPK
ncbi:MAG: hypothetical protein ACM3SQ_16110 [Betaproteobacteria bacterium]